MRVLHLALTEEAGAVVVRANDKLLGAPWDTPYVHPGQEMTDGGNLIPSAS